MSNEPKPNTTDPSTLPANTGIDVPEKTNVPDADRTVKGTLPTERQQMDKSASDDNLAQEHHTGRDHSEPTDVTDTTNDNAIDSEYIDVGGGD